ncbi:uncharacterized protein LOC115083494 [Rhinatrema bivittatum]|uniref:uncharacterized protein LOC115083494 n=1 Tax=Rhinatrema bivittatum TaxID=194408 RepID=UPI001127C241|nr:uncharacterized protein LOC115083494 [Rhinatrema bivittatum]
MFALQLYWLLRRRRRLEAAGRRERGRERPDGARAAAAEQERVNAVRRAVAERERANAAFVEQERVYAARGVFVEQARASTAGGAVAKQEKANGAREAFVEQERADADLGAVAKQESADSAFVEQARVAYVPFVEQERVDAILGAVSKQERGDAVFVEQQGADAAFVEQERADEAFVEQERGDEAFVEQERGDAVFVEQERGDEAFVEQERADASPGTLAKQERADTFFVEQERGDEAYVDLVEQEKADSVPLAKGKRADAPFVALERVNVAPGTVAKQERVDASFVEQDRIDAAGGALVEQDRIDAAGGALVEQKKDEGEKRGPPPRGRRRVHGQRRQRVFSTRTTLLGLPEEEVVRRYRLSSVAIMALYEDLKDDLDPLTGRSHAIPGLVKLLSAIHFLGSGSFQTTVAIVGGMEQSTFSRCFRQVLQAMTSRVRNYIQFPNQRQQWQDLKANFFAIAGLPNVMGVIDCMHVALIPPRDREASFRNCKHFHSLNVQVVCDAHMNILNVVPRYPGSCHDSYILRHSALFRQFEEGMYGQGWLLGDAGYGCRPWLLTPVAQPRTPAERRYNEAHTSTHSVIERTFRVLKSRFKCLDKSAGALQYCPLKVAEIVLACCILHNIAVKYQVPGDINPDIEEDPPCPPADARETTEGGSQVRSSLIVEYFA